MRAVLAYALGVALVVHVGAHVALTAHLARRRPRWRAAVAFFVTPLAFWWGLETPARKLSFSWLAAVVVYAVLVAVA